MWNDRYINRGWVDVVFDPITATMLVLTAAGTGLKAAGTIAAGNAAADAGIARANALNYDAVQRDQQAQESRAAAQRLAFEKRREGTLLESTLQARAAASGGGADDPTVLNLGENIAQRSEYGALMEMYKGENRARGLEDQAIGDRYSAGAALEEDKGKQKAARMEAWGTLIGGAGSAFRQYNGVPDVRYG